MLYYRATVLLSTHCFLIDILILLGYMSLWLIKLSVVNITINLATWTCSTLHAPGVQSCVLLFWQFASFVSKHLVGAVDQYNLLEINTRVYIGLGLCLLDNNCVTCNSSPWKYTSLVNICTTEVAKPSLSVLLPWAQEDNHPTFCRWKGKI